MAIPDYMSDVYLHDPETKELASGRTLGKRKSRSNDDELWPEPRAPISMLPGMSRDRWRESPPRRRDHYDPPFPQRERFPPHDRFPPTRERYPPPRHPFADPRRRFDNPRDRLGMRQRYPPPHPYPDPYLNRYPPGLPQRGLHPPLMPQMMPPARREKINKRKFYIGQEVKAHWDKGDYEHAIIQNETPTGYLVVFSEYGESYEVEDTDIRRLRKEELGPGNYWCELCQVETGCAKTLLTHIVGKKHQKKLQDGTPEEIDLDKVHEGVEEVGSEGEGKLVSDLKDEATALSRLWYKSAGKNLIHNITVIEEEGEPHCRVFTATCTIGGEVVGLGSAANKKQARQRAAISALKVIEGMPTRPRTSEDRERWAAMSKFYKAKRAGVGAD